MNDKKKQPEVKTPSVVLSFKFASEEAQRRATKEGANFAVYLISAGPWEGRHTFEPSSVRVPSTWTHVQTFEPETAPLEVGSLEIEEADAPLSLRLQGMNATTEGFHEKNLLKVEATDAAAVKRPSVCEYCLRGVALDALGGKHIVGGALDVQPCAASADVWIEGENVGGAMAEAIQVATRLARGEQKTFVVYAAKTCYLVRREGVKLPEDLGAHVAKTISPLSPPPTCSFMPHVERDERSGQAKAIRSTCACGQWFGVVEDETLQTSEDELRRRAFAGYAEHVGTVEPRIIVGGPFVVHARRGDVTQIVSGRDPLAMICGKELRPTQLFAGVPSGARLTNCPCCVELSTEAIRRGARFSFAVENYPDPARHELLTLFGKRIGGGDTAKIVNAFCTCGEWNFGFEVAEDLSDLSAIQEASARHAELHLSQLPADEDEDRATYEAPTKKEEILRLYEEGVQDVAELVRRVKARPSYVAQVLQQAGHLEGVFDLYTTTGREQNVYTRYFRNVLAFRNVEAARESVQRIDRLYNYFERLGDRAGQHQATVLALVGKNRARWSGKLEESEIFSEWLKAH